MNAQQIAAYEALCANVPEARHPSLTFKLHVFQFFYGDEQSEISDDDALAILTDHLERMLPSGATLLFPDKVSQ